MNTASDATEDRRQSLAWLGLLHRIVLSAIILSVPLTVGCTRTTAQRGVEPRWQTLAADDLVRGVTTKAEIMRRLGPPSQVITRPGGDIFYYLHEEARTRGLILIVFNRSESETRYERAIFFFDSDGYLQEYALSEEGDSN